MSPFHQDQLASAGVTADASKEAGRIAASLAALLAGIPSPQTTAVVGFILAEGFRQTQELAAMGDRTIDPRLVEWASRTFDAREAAANLRDIRETGGLRLADFDADLERLARG